MTIHYQLSLRPAIPNIYYGAADFREFRDQLEQMDNLLRYSDAVRTLTKSIVLIRNQGLKNSMPKPSGFRIKKRL